MPNIDQRPFDEDRNRHGEWLTYYDNGQLEYRMNYVHGIPHGLDEAYNEDGTLVYRGNYNMGRQIGYWNWENEKEYHLCLI